jgi:preprotein translocase subunit SecA
MIRLLRIFAGERLRAIMDKLKMPEGEAIEHPLVTRSLESAQRKVEAATSTSASSCSNTTTFPTTSAR